MVIGRLAVYLRRDLMKNSDEFLRRRKRGVEYIGAICTDTNERTKGINERNEVRVRVVVCVINTAQV